MHRERLARVSAITLLSLQSGEVADFAPAGLLLGFVIRFWEAPHRLIEMMPCWPNSIIDDQRSILGHPWY